VAGHPDTRWVPIMGVEISPLARGTSHSTLSNCSDSFVRMPPVEPEAGALREIQPVKLPLNRKHVDALFPGMRFRKVRPRLGRYQIRKLGNRAQRHPPETIPCGLLGGQSSTRNGRLSIQISGTVPLCDEFRYTPFAMGRFFKEAGFEGICVAALGGWDASLAQIIGLWVRRRPMSKSKRRLLQGALFPIYCKLLRLDARPEKFDKSVMITGLCATGRKGRT
jgi:hypothetical protein